MSFEKFEFNRNNMDFERYFGDHASLAGVYCSEKYPEAVRIMKERGLTVATAESCTGGLVGKLFTDVSGSSAVFKGGIMAYTNDVKNRVLGVSSDIIDKYTEVSYEAAAEMAQRARALFDADMGIATTGFAGPTGGNEKDPVGTVYIAVASSEKCLVCRAEFGDWLTRGGVRSCSAYLAVRWLLGLLSVN